MCNLCSSFYIVKETRRGVFRYSIDHNNNLVVSFECRDGVWIGDYIETNYCPMCGRKLKEEQ